MINIGKNYLDGFNLANSEIGCDDDDTILNLHYYYYQLKIKEIEAEKNRELYTNRRLEEVLVAINNIYMTKYSITNQVALNSQDYASLLLKLQQYFTNHLNYTNSEYKTVMINYNRLLFSIALTMHSKEDIDRAFFQKEMGCFVGYYFKNQKDLAKIVLNDKDINKIIHFNTTADRSQYPTSENNGNIIFFPNKKTGKR